MNNPSDNYLPVELNFRTCIIKRDYQTNQKFVSLEGLSGVTQDIIDFNAEIYDVGEKFYAYLVPNQLISGNSEDDKYTLMNINSFAPYLVGSFPPSASLTNCGSGGSKPPGGGGGQSSFAPPGQALSSSNNDIGNEITLALEKARETHPYLTKSNLTINDYGSPIIVFSEIAIDPWQRIDTSQFNFPSLYGISYAIMQDNNYTFTWIHDGT